MRELLIAAAAGALLASLFAGCGGDPGLEDTRWVLVSLGGEAPTGSDETPFLGTSREGEELRIFGFSGCNRFHGSCALEGASIECGPLASTRMACPEPAMQLEMRLLGALGAARQWEIAEGRLTLRGPDAEVAVFEASTD